jgi:hypothetical protein
VPLKESGATRTRDTASMIRLYRADWSTNWERVALALASSGIDALPRV